MGNTDYSWMYTATNEEIEFYFKKEEKLKSLRDAALATLLKINFGDEGYGFKFLDCHSGKFYDVNINGLGVFEWFVVHHDTMFEDVKEIREEIKRLSLS